MAKNSFTAAYEDLPKIAKILIQFFLSYIISIGGIYRIIRYFETKNVTTLVVGILALIPPITVVFWIIDLVTEIMNNKITVLAD